MDAQGDRGALAALLRHYRAAAGLSQEHLAERAGLSRRGIADLERGARRWPYPDTTRRLAEALGLNAADRAAFLAAGQRPGDDEAFSAAGLLGRELELREIKQLLRTTRLLTLTGPGGIGKTRLALLLMEAAAPTMPSVIVDLAPVHDPELLVSAIARPLDVYDAGGRPLVQSLIGSLRRRRVVLVLDSFEHLLSAARVVAELLEQCPGLSILATSREPLRLRQEWVFTVGPLAVPASASVDPHALLECPSVALFVRRARARGQFSFTAQNAAAVAETCRRLDGLPLAIELAAARAPALGAQTILTRTALGLDLLSDAAPDLPVRHRSLRATIGWSYDLLATQEQAVFRRLSVLPGGWTLATAEVICTDRLVTADALPHLVDQLVEKSLVRVDASTEPPRYRYLDTLRQFALEQLFAAGEADQLHRQLLQWALSFAERGVAIAHGPSQRSVLAQFDEEHDNLRAALVWATEAGRVNDALRLASRMGGFWEMGGFLHEGQARLRGLLSIDAAVEPGRRAAALAALGSISFLQGDHVAGAAELDRALALYRSGGQQTGAAWAAAKLGIVLLSDGQVERAEPLLSESAAWGRRQGEPLVVAWAQFGLAYVAFQRGQTELAVDLLQDILTICRRLENMWGIAIAQYHLGRLAWLRGDYELALTLQAESLMHWWNLRDRRAVADALEGLALLASSRQAYARAAQLFSAAEIARESAGAAVLPYLLEHREMALTRTRAALPPADFDNAWSSGRSMPLADAVALALSETAFALPESRATP